jgi:hypothetical protein
LNDIVYIEPTKTENKNVDLSTVSTPKKSGVLTTNIGNINDILFEAKTKPINTKLDDVYANDDVNIDNSKELKKIETIGEQKVKGKINLGKLF